MSTFANSVIVSGTNTLIVGGTVSVSGTSTFGAAVSVESLIPLFVCVCNAHFPLFPQIPSSALTVGGATSLQSTAVIILFVCVSVLFFLNHVCVCMS